MQYRIRNGDRVIDTVGGRNLARNTDKDIIIDDTTNTGTQGWRFRDINLTQRLKVGDRITVSTEGTLTGKGDLSRYEVTLYDPGILFRRSNVGSLTSGKWSSATLTVANLNGAGDTILLIYAGKIADTEGKRNVIHRLKVEFGSVATPWSPAPEDYGITDRNAAYRVTGLAPNTSYNLSVAPFNGLREGPKESITVHTRGLRITVPVGITPGTAVTLHYQEYSLGLVPLGTEPGGMFGGGNRQEAPAKVISSSGDSSVLEITSNFNLMNDNMTMNKIADKSFAAFQGYKALYFNEG